MPQVPQANILPSALWFEGHFSRWQAAGTPAKPDAKDTRDRFLNLRLVKSTRWVDSFDGSRRSRVRHASTRSSTRRSSACIPCVCLCRPLHRRFPWSWWVFHGQSKRVWNRVPLWRQVPLEGSLPVRRQLLLRSFLCWASGSETSSNTVFLRVYCRCSVCVQKQR